MHNLLLNIFGVVLLSLIRVDSYLAHANSIESTSNVTQIRKLSSTTLYEDTKLKLKKLLSLIYNRYEFGGPYGNKFFMTSNNISPETWDLLKIKLAVKMLTPGSKFLMVFSGSSVTAGHDNYYAQSYPYIFKSRMEDIFKSAGIELVVRDIAQGANNCSPYVLCYESMGGMDPDFLNWEQSYNCGRDEAVFEATARTAGRSAQKGIVYYSASGAWAPSSCPPSTDTLPYSAEEWSPEVAGLSPWDADEEQLMGMKQMLFQFNQNKPSYARFTGPFRNDYAGVGMMGFNVWEQNAHCRFKNPKTGQDDSCNGIDSVEGCSMKFMTKEASYYGSDNQQGANWHPTRAFHMLRGEAIAWIFGLVLLETVHELQNQLNIKPTEDLRREYEGFLGDLTPPLPNPKKCGYPYHCELRPLCFTDFQPHYSANMTLTELVVGATQWEYDDAKLGEWSLHYGYLDAKPMYLGRGAAQGEIHLRVRINTARFLWLCGNNKDALQYAIVQLDANIADTTTLKETYTPSANRKILTKFAQIGNECRQYEDLPLGTHVLSVSTDPTQPEHITVLTHVIMWP